MGLCYDTSKWADSIWDRHTKQSSSAAGTLSEGRAKQQQAFDEFARDIHSRLYLINDPEKLEGAPEWATKIHEAATELSEWQQLRKRCHSHGVASAVAAEEILRELVRLVPLASKDESQDKKQDQGKPGQNGPQAPGGSQAGDASGDASEGSGDGQDDGSPKDGSQGSKGQGKPTEKAPGASSDQDQDGNGKAALRRVIRKAIRKASEEVSEVEKAVEGLSDACGLPGNSPSDNATMKDFDKVRSAYQRIRNNPKMRKVIELAGRMQRMAASKKRSKVTSSAGAVRGITLSGDVSRIVPSEFAGLRSSSRMLRLDTFRKILGRTALSYRVENEETEKQGPIIVLVDESGSMKGDREMWSKAVALSLLSKATDQRRNWHLIGFGYSINHTTSFQPGKATVEQIEAALSARCSGGTRFGAPLEKALSLLAEEPGLKKADIVIVTDGEAEIPTNIREELIAKTKKEGLNVFAVGVGNQAQIEDSFRDVATEFVNVYDMQDTSKAAGVINSADRR